MRRFGFVGVFAALISMECGCGSGGQLPTPTEGSTDGATGATDAPLGDGSPSDASAPDGPEMDVALLDGSALDGTAPDAAVLDAAPVDGASLDGPTDAPAMVMSACDNSALLAGCVVGQCTVSAADSPLPAGASITVTQSPIPADLSGDTLGSALCSIASPAGVSSLPNLTLSIALSAPPAASAVLFQYVSPSISRGIVTSQSSGSAVVGLVAAPGTFGATERPTGWTLQTDVGLDISSSADQASLLRNLSSKAMSGAFFDGTRLFLCNGSRVLIYNGIPANPGVLPTVVLGQPDLNTVSTETTSSLFGASGCSGLWSDGTRLAVTTGNRILIWNAIPSSNAAPADVVLGQPDFSSTAANSGGVGAASLSSPAGIDSDGTRLAVAEIFNQRVLVWNTFPTGIDQPADVVIGQPDFTTDSINVGAAPIYQAWGVAFASQGMFFTGKFDPGLAYIAATTASNPPIDFTVLPIGYTVDPPTDLIYPGLIARTPGGGLAVRDSARVAMMKAIPTAPSSIDFVLGQPDPTRVVESQVSASSLSAGDDLGAGKVVLVPDSRRLLVFDSPPTFNFEPASRVVGQAGFTTNGQIDYRGISATTLAGPGDVAIGGGFVAVADTSNNRVLLYRATDIAAGNQAASVVLGQTDSASYVPNFDQQTPSAARMSGPSGVALDGTHLIVADTENHRVLVWNSVPSTTGVPADMVLGQADFSGRKPNRGNGDQNGDGYSDADALGFFYPTGVASDGTHLFVADRLNNRVLAWTTFPSTNGQAADDVIGQADFTSSGANAVSGPYAFVPDGLDLPTGVTLAGTTLWVADTENNRVVRWDDATTSPIPGAFAGQSSGTSVANPNYFVAPGTAIGQAQTVPTTATSVLRPRAVAVVGGTLYVSESDSNRVHMLDSTTLASLGELGQSADGVGTSNANGIGPSSLATPLGLASDGSTLWVADSANNRVVGYGVATTPSTGAGATSVLGQPTLLTNGFDQTSSAASGATSQPHGVAVANGSLYIADTSNNRVLVMTLPVAPGQQPAAVYGQPNSTLALPNSGGLATATSLSGPQGVFADSAHVVVADSANNRVLIYPANAANGAATLVLGQATFATTAANPGGPSATTMMRPTAAYSDGTALWVADTGNHRVLGWKSFPTANGQAADVVIGQSTFSAMLPNQGNAAASASSLSFPSGILSFGGVLYIADSGNNRVVIFSAPPASGGSADGVLGQPDLVSRTPAASANDLTALAGPVALTQDGENLYVVDRDLARVLTYDLGTLKSGSQAAFSIGATGGLSLTGPQGVAAERTPFFTSRLYIGDTGDNQVAIVQSVTRLDLE